MSGPKRARLSGAARAEAEAEMEGVKRNFAAKVACPVYDGYPYGHVPVSYAIDSLRAKTITAEGVLRQ